MIDESTFDNFSIPNVLKNLSFNIYDYQLIPKKINVLNQNDKFLNINVACQNSLNRNRNSSYLDTKMHEEDKECNCYFNNATRNFLSKKNKSLIKELCLPNKCQRNHSFQDQKGTNIIPQKYNKKTINNHPKRNILIEKLFKNKIILSKINLFNLKAQTKGISKSNKLHIRNKYSDRSILKIKEKTKQITEKQSQDKIRRMHIQFDFHTKKLNKCGNENEKCLIFPKDPYQQELPSIHISKKFLLENDQKKSNIVNIYIK